MGGSALGFRGPRGLHSRCRSGGDLHTGLRLPQVRGRGHSGTEGGGGRGQGSRVPGARGHSSAWSRGSCVPSPRCRFVSAGTRLRDTCEGVAWTSRGGALPAGCPGPGWVHEPHARAPRAADGPRSGVGAGSPDLGTRAHRHTRACTHATCRQPVRAHTAHMTVHGCMRSLTHTFTLTLTQAPPTYLHTHTLIHAHTQAHTHACTQTHRLTHRLVYTHSLTHTPGHTPCLHTYTQGPPHLAHTHSYRLTHRLAHAHMLARTQAHTHTRAHHPCACAPGRCRGSTPLPPVPLLRGIL